ncbi:MAG: DUF302 domain-containing protein [Solirubrobacteraceae bacterium]
MIFGSPVAGTPIMEACPFVALDLPLKIMIFDDGGTTPGLPPRPRGAGRAVRPPRPLGCAAGHDQRTRRESGSRLSARSLS